MSVYNNLYWYMPIFLCLIVLLPNTPNKRLNGSTKHSILLRPKVLILSVVLHSDDSSAKITNNKGLFGQKLKRIQTSLRTVGLLG